MDIYVALLCLLIIAKPVLGFGIDPDNQIDIINELVFANATYGLTQVTGLHNNSKAFLFRDVSRAVQTPAHITEKVVQRFRSKSEFTFLASIQQKSSTSGVIFSIHESEHSYFELESSGLREELRYHYRYKDKPRSESFPYRLADGQWHQIAISVSATHLLLHVDCNRIYERVIDPPQMDLTPSTGVWLGQHSPRHGLFKAAAIIIRIHCRDSRSCLPSPPVWTTAMDSSLGYRQSPGQAPVCAELRVPTSTKPWKAYHPCPHPPSPHLYHPSFQ
ncbi:hypothetical protein DPEC_G00348260 [Dallia pectoralis]|uniref:Uncharacterized protein n=1 Tax=Dallia pectoralis TaxID=75939 RepID=A0ACC2F4F0_DALPE|nr:hypothetical protein DPEC_G00348260 [Dallia pectoralis]